MVGFFSWVVEVSLVNIRLLLCIVMDVCRLSVLKDCCYVVRRLSLLVVVCRVVWL